MGIPRFLILSGFSPRFTVTHNVGIISPHVWSGPITWPSIISIVALLELSRNWFVAVQGWAVLYLLFGQIDVDILLFFIHSDQRIRGDQHLLTREPVSCFGDQITNCPVVVIKVEFFDPPYFPVGAVQFVTLSCFDFVEHNNT